MDDKTKITRRSNEQAPVVIRLEELVEDDARKTYLKTFVAEAMCESESELRIKAMQLLYVIGRGGSEFNDILDGARIIQSYVRTHGSNGKSREELHLVIKRENSFQDVYVENVPDKFSGNPVYCFNFEPNNSNVNSNS
jgi:hypothetical protein